MPSNPTDPAQGFDTALVRELAGILNETGLTEIEVGRGDVKIRVARSATPLGAVQIPPAAASGVPPPPGAPASVAESVAAGEIVKSPMVGTVYLQAQPGAPPFAKVGDTVQKGDTLLLVEAMKTMNPIAAPRNGRLLEFLVADGQPVEFGEPLIRLE